MMLKYGSLLKIVDFPFAYALIVYPIFFLNIGSPILDNEMITDTNSTSIVEIKNAQMIDQTHTKTVQKSDSQQFDIFSLFILAGLLATILIIVDPIGRIIRLLIVKVFFSGKSFEISRKLRTIEVLENNIKLIQAQIDETLIEVLDENERKKEIEKLNKQLEEKQMELENENEKVDKEIPKRLYLFRKKIKKIIQESFHVFELHQKDDNRKDIDENILEIIAKSFTRHAVQTKSITVETDKIVGQVYFFIIIVLFTTSMIDDTFYQNIVGNNINNLIEANKTSDGNIDSIIVNFLNWGNDNHIPFIVLAILIIVSSMMLAIWIELKKLIKKSRTVSIYLLAIENGNNKSAKIMMSAIKESQWILAEIRSENYAANLKP